MSSTTDTEIPLALRRPKRKNSALDSPQKKTAPETWTQRNVAVTPGRRSKRVRFSDSALPSASNPLATGITPHLRRASLGTIRTQVPSTPTTSTRFSTNNVEFTPFRQVLDDRAKRRICRNGMSEEMNGYEADKKCKAKLLQEIDAKDTELKRLRLELEEARSKAVCVDAASIPPAPSQQRLDQVEAELEALRQSFALEEANPPVPSWAHVPLGTAGPGSEGGDTIRIYEDDDADLSSNHLYQHAPTIDADSLAMGLELEAARQAKKSMLGSFRESISIAEMNFADSPARRQHKAVGASPRAPNSFYHDLSKQLKATTCRAEEAELALRSLEMEVASLGFGVESSSASEDVTTIAKHFRQARLDLERVVPGETIIAFENAKVLPEIISKIQSISSALHLREAELKAAKDQQHNLKNNFEKAIVAAEKATARVKDLESSIDSTAEEMLHLRIRVQDLENDVAEKEKDVSTLTAALNKYRADVSRLETLITNLENSHTAALSAKDQIMSDLDAKVAAETRGRRAAESSAVARLAKISELEAALSNARSHADRVEEAITKIESQMESSNSAHLEEVGGLNTRISNLSTALANANAEVEKLKVTKARLEERVRQEVEQSASTIEAIQARLIRSVAGTHEERKRHMRAAKVRAANWDLMSDDLQSDGIEPHQQLLTPASLVRFSEFSEEISPPGTEMGDSIRVDDDDDDVTGEGQQQQEQEHDLPASIEIGRGTTPSMRSRSADRRQSHGHSGMGILKKGPRRPRRKYDSGIGMSSDLEIDLEIDTGIESSRRRGGKSSNKNNDGEVEVEVEVKDDSGYGSGSLTPELENPLSSDVDLDLDRYLESRRQRQERQQQSRGVGMSMVM